MVLIRVARAERLATTNALIASTLPSLDLPAPCARPDRAARAASMASAGSDLPVRRRDWRLGRSTSSTAMPELRSERAKVAPYELVPSMPTRATAPKLSSQPSNWPCPVRVAGNSATPSSPPIGSRAAATFMSKWVSTPPVTARAGSTIVIAIPSSHLSKGWHAQHQGVRRRCDRPVGSGRSAAPRSGSCHCHLVPGRQIESEDRLTVSRLWSQAGTS
jgi:hypothetical protein